MPRGRVLIVESDEKAGQAIARGLVARGYEVLRAASGSDAVNKAFAEKPDAITIAAELPDIDGAAACHEIRRGLLVPIILIGRRGDDADFVLGLGAGADCYLTRPVGMTRLLALVEAAVRRQVVYSRGRAEPETLAVRDLTLDLAAHELKRNGETIPLSRTEFRVVVALARHAGSVLSRGQLLESVWNLKVDGIYSRTVDVHIGRIRRKIGDDAGDRRYIVTVPGLGYKMTP